MCFVPFDLFATCEQVFKAKFQPYIFLTTVSNYREERKLKLLINVHIKRQEIQAATFEIFVIFFWIFVNYEAFFWNFLMSNFPAFYVHNRDKPNFNRTTCSSCARTRGMKYSNIFFLKYSIIFFVGPYIPYLRILMISSFPTYLQVLIYQCNVMSCDISCVAGQISYNLILDYNQNYCPTLCRFLWDLLNSINY